MALHPTTAALTDQIAERSRPGGPHDLLSIDQQPERGATRVATGCVCRAPGFAASEEIA